jgi:hypothetical protein
MRGLLGLRHLRQLLLLALATTPVVALLSVGAVEATASSTPLHHARPHRAKHKAPARKQTAAQRRAALRKQLLANPRLMLNSSFMHRLEVAGAMVPMTIRLKRPYEGGDGDDVLRLTWDPATEPWPLPDTTAPSESLTNLSGSLTYEWDFSADTSGYATLGTIETLLGGGISGTSTGFPIAADNPLADCAAATPPSIKSLRATGMSFTSAGSRFGIVNPFSGDISGTINLRTQIRTIATTCAGDQPSQLATTTSDDPPLPVPFNGKFTVSPGVTSDGILRLGVIKLDADTMPQRSVYGYIWACTVPSASNPSDLCNRQKFPVRTSFKSLSAEVLVGDHMPDPPPPPA